MTDSEDASEGPSFRSFRFNFPGGSPPAGHLDRCWWEARQLIASLQLIGVVPASRGDLYSASVAFSCDLVSGEQPLRTEFARVSHSGPPWSSSFDRLGYLAEELVCLPTDDEAAPIETVLAMTKDGSCIQRVVCRSARPRQRTDAELIEVVERHLPRASIRVVYAGCELEYARLRDLGLVTKPHPIRSDLDDIVRRVDNAVTKITSLVSRCSGYGRELLLWFLDNPGARFFGSDLRTLGQPRGSKPRALSKNLGPRFCSEAVAAGILSQDPNTTGSGRRPRFSVRKLPEEVEARARAELGC